LGYLVYSHLMLFVTSLTIWNLLPHNSSMNIVCIVILGVYCFLLEPNNVYYCRIDCHQVPTAGLCLVPWPFCWIASSGSSVQQPEVWVCSLSEQLGGISYYTLMQKASVLSIYQLLSIVLQWTSESSHLGSSDICFWFIPRIVTFGSSGSSMFSFLKNLQALSQNSGIKIYSYHFPGSLLAIHVLTNKIYP
jgi:hypothetical protein